MLWQPPGERACDACVAQRNPAPNLHRVHMSFVLSDLWHCTFMEEDLRTTAARPRAFTSSDTLIEMIRRGNGFRDLASRQAVEHAIQSGRGNVDLFLTAEQYARLVGK